MKIARLGGLPLAASIVALTGLSAVAQAHHSSGQFDTGNCINISGTVRALEWVYPHSWLWIEVTGGSGSSSGGDADAWGFEFASPTQMINLDHRWSKTTLAKGEKVTVNFSPMKDGRHGGWMHSVTAADGKVLAGAPGLCERSQPLTPQESVGPIKAPAAAQ